MAEKGTILEWKKYSEISRISFEKLYYDIHFTDVTIACEGNHKIEAHKVILSTCSSFFSKILKQNVNPHPLIYLQGVSIDDLVLLKECMYFGRATVLRNQLKSFMTVSEAILDFNEDKIPQYVHTTNGEGTHDNDIDGATAPLSNVKDSLSENIFPTQIDDIVGRAIEVDKGDNLNIGSLNRSQHNKDQVEIPKKQLVPFKYIKQIKRAKVSCNKCNYATLYNSKLVKHITRRHHKVCPTCQIVFDHKTLLEKHVIQNHTVYTCEICSYSTKWGSSLSRHSRIHNETMIQCDQCDFTCLKNSDLLKHMDSKHNTSEYNCDKCDVKTRTKIMLKFHDEKVHQGIRYFCEICDFRATHRQNLRAHQKNVHDKIRYSCQVCSFSDSQVSRVKLHEQRKHEVSLKDSI